MASNPQRLGRYDILRPLGSGGMGEVYVAHDPLLGRNVAIKILPERLAGDRDALARFTQEARSASALSHPNIVTIYEIGTDHGKPFIAMEYIDGRDLRTLINEGPQSNRLTVDVAAQIADGLAAAHEHSIIHRDLKPENVMVTKDGFVKILDFGLAKLLAEGDELSNTVEFRAPSTMPGTILGTVGYMSPEQATGRRIDFRSDQFALGAMLYELATGHAAFERENAIDVMSAILHEEPPPVRDFNARAPLPLTWVIDRLLQKEPSGRYATTRECANELKALRDRIHAEGSALDLPKPPVLTSKQRRTIGIAIGTLVALLLFLAIAVINRRQPAGPQAAVATAQQQPKSYVAVLPFRDLSGDANGQLIGDGFAETVSSRLARLPSVQLIRPKPQDIAGGDDIQKIGRDLGVTMIVRGSMQRAGNRIRISYAIVGAQNGSQLAADTVDGAAAELFDVQDKIVTRIASYLDPKATPQHFPNLDPNVSQQRYLEALGHLRRYDDEKSLDAAISTLEDLGTTSATVQAALGRAYLAKYVITRDPQSIKKASEYCDTAAKADSLNPDVHVTLGQVALQTGEADRAIAEFGRALQQQPNSVDSFVGLARAYDLKKEPARAEAAYKRAIDLQPKYWGSYSALGAFYFAHRQYPASAAMFQKVVQLVPDNMRGYNNLGGVYEQMGRYDEAIGFFQKTIDQKPTAQAYSNLGTCYYFLGRYHDSATMFEKAIGLTPENYKYWANLGDAYRESLSDAQRSRAAYEHAISLARDELKRNPNDVSIRARLAECLAKDGDAGSARREIEDALKRDPANSFVLYRAAMVCAVQGEDDEAAKWLAQAIAKGYSRTEIELEPEFAKARKTAAYQHLPNPAV
ncbi:MAG TPA: protein kinase [Thermoanaerobaculia bacterium]|nr:protein kinase [Thermoanaerobaculia bacterium]